jgi:hypothetical protein
VILLDVSPLAGGIGIFAGVAFLLIFLAIAFVAFKLLKKSVKMAFRVTIVGIIVAIAVAGSAFFLMLGTSKPARTPQKTASQSK